MLQESRHVTKYKHITEGMHAKNMDMWQENRCVTKYRHVTAV